MSCRVRLVAACASLAAAALCAACGPSEPGPPGPEGPQGPMGETGVAGPAGPAGTTGQDVFETYGTGQLVVTSATTTFVTIPGLTQTLNVPAGARVRVDTNGGIQCAGLGNAYVAVDIALFVDNQAPGQAGMRRVVAANTATVGQMIANWSFGRTFTLNEGAHVFEARAINVDTTTAAANVSSGSAPQIQGVLTVTIIKQ